MSFDAESPHVAEEPATIFPARKELAPITDPIELRDRTIRDYTRAMGAPGMPSTSAQIEALAKADLQLTDAYHRDTPVGMAPTAAQHDSAIAAKRETAEERARELGAEITRGPHAATDRFGPQVDLPPEYGLSERWQLAKGRLARICAGAGAPRRHADGSFDFAAMTSTCVMPRLAHRYLAAWFNFDLRYVPQTERHNPFFGMSAREASLRLSREVEDICDASSGRLGPWFVPK